MKPVNSTALAAGARRSCAQTAGEAFRPIPRWTLYGLIEGCSRHLGLNTGDLAAMRAMLSFLPLKDAKGAELPARQDMLLICYASNASICSRAGGMDESSLRRHIRKLSSLGLVQRHDSATGKRFPLKRGGKVLDAFGIDLSPAFRSAERLQRQLNTIQAQEEERRALRSETLSLRRRALEAITQMDEDLRGFLAGITNLMRRKTTTIQQIATVRDRLLKLLAAASNQAPASRRATWIARGQP